MNRAALVEANVPLHGTVTPAWPAVADTPSPDLYGAAKVPQPRLRYSYEPVDWRARLAGVGGTGAVLLVLAVAAFVRLHVAPPKVATSQPLTVVYFERLEAPADPVREVPEGPEQVQQNASRGQADEQPADVPPPRLPLPLPDQAVPRPAERAVAAEAVRDTSAPKSIPAPPAARAATNVAATWQAMVMAHLEKYRRYPAAARARGQQGVVQVTFRMNRQGRVLSARISRTSGSAMLDRAAIDNVKRAQPLPAIPDDMPGELELAVEVEFFRL